MYHAPHGINLNGISKMNNGTDRTAVTKSSDRLGYFTEITLVLALVIISFLAAAYFFDFSPDDRRIPVAAVSTD